MTTGEAPALLLGDDFIRERHVRYAELRRTGGVHRAVMPDGLPVWLVSGYDQARAALADPRLSKDSVKAAPLHQRRARERGEDAPRVRLPEQLTAHMLNMDPPDHTRLRRLMSTGFTSRRVRGLRPRIEEITAGLLDELAGREEADLLADFAIPLPLTVICELFGVPESDRAPFRSWADSLARYTDVGAAIKASAAMADFLAGLIARRLEAPGDDLLTALVQAGDDGDRLSGTELVAMAFLLLSAGHETTAHLIANAVRVLLAYPDQLAAIRADPALLPGAIEELLRHQTPTGITTLRFTTAPVRLGDVEIPEGEFVVIALESANRDDEQFTDAERLDITRDPSGHLAFGHGVHFCAGAHLARLEGHIAIGRLLDRFPDMTLAAPADGLRWRDSLIFRGLESLPVRLAG